jgi:23S rRNA pseudouridine2605 synthase
MTESNDARIIRLNKYLALQLGISRREADDLIDKGKVKINDTVARLGARISLDDTVHADGKPLHGATRIQYLALHKPVGYVSSRRAQGDNPTIYSLLPPEYHTLKTVGRLDRDSSGLLLLTNDGDFAYQMTHPKFAKIKIYQVQLDHSLEPLHQQMISDHGVRLDDGVSKFAITRGDTDPKTGSTTYDVTMHEGRNRQIRRTFVALGYTVTRLHRIQFGRFSLGDMKPGEYRPLDISVGE